MSGVVVGTKRDEIVVELFLSFPLALYATNGSENQPYLASESVA